MSSIAPFHLAIPVNDLEKCREFYKNALGCREGRSDQRWVDFDFFGHQLVIHQKKEMSIKENPISKVIKEMYAHSDRSGLF